jgi:hypothetical protein
VEQAGIGLVDNAAKFGRNMPSTGLQSAQLALSAGGQATGQIGSQQQAINTTYAPAQGFYGGATNATSSAGNLLMGASNVQQQAGAANAQSMGSMAGTALAAGMMFMSKSTIKNIEGDVDPELALSSVIATPVKAWRYKKGEGDGDTRLRLGPMAEDVAASTGVGDGQTLDIATELGTLRAAVQALAKDNARRKVSKAPRSEQLMLSALPI